MPGNRDGMIRYLEAQGATVRKSKKGLFIQHAGGTTTIHNTPSDRRSILNEIADFRRIGLRHPMDKAEKDKARVKGEYPPYVFAGVSKDMEKRGRQLLFTKGWPLEVTALELRELGDPSTIGKFLYYTGYRWHPEGKREGRAKVWVAPPEIVEYHDELLRASAELDVDVRLRESVPTVELISEEPPVREPEQKSGDEQPEVSEPDGCDECEEDGSVESIDYIDERDSWVVDPKELLGEYLHRMVSERLAVLGAVGIEFEIRVWRKS